MTKTMSCGSIMPGCKTVIEGKDVQEVMSKASQHASKEHGIKEVTPDLAKKVQAAIRDK